MKLFTQKTINLLVAGLFILSGAKAQAEETENKEISYKKKVTLSLNARSLNTFAQPLLESFVFTTPELKLNYFMNERVSLGIGLSSNILINNLSLSGKYYITSTPDRKWNLYTESNLNGSIIILGSSASFTQKVGAELRFNEHWFMNLSAGGGLVFTRGGGPGYSESFPEKIMPATDFSLGFGYAF